MLRSAFLALEDDHRRRQTSGSADAHEHAAARIDDEAGQQFRRVGVLIDRVIPQREKDERIERSRGVMRPSPTEIPLSVRQSAP